LVVGGWLPSLGLAWLGLVWFFSLSLSSFLPLYPTVTQLGRFL
jgi:hypothetical protein